MERLHLQKPLHQVVDAVVLGWFGVVAQQLTPHHLGPEVGELDAQRHQQFHAATAGEGGHGDWPPVEQGSEVVVGHREPGNGIGERRRNRAVVFRGADHPARCLVQLVMQGLEVRPRSRCLDARREQRQLEPCEVDQFGTGLLSRCGLHEAFRQLEVLAIARCQNDEIRGHGDVGS